METQFGHNAYAGQINKTPPVWEAFCEGGFEECEGYIPVNDIAVIAQTLMRAANPKTVGTMTRGISFILS